MAQAIFNNGDTALNVRASINRMEWVDTKDPQSSDDSASGYKVGNLWLNSNSRSLFVCVNNAAGSAIWQKLPCSIDDLGGQRKILYGTSEPSSSLGTNGDIYIQIEI